MPTCVCTSSATKALHVGHMKRVRIAYPKTGIMRGMTNASNAKKPTDKPTTSAHAHAHACPFKYKHPRTKSENDNNDMRTNANVKVWIVGPVLCVLTQFLRRADKHDNITRGNRRCRHARWSNRRCEQRCYGLQRRGNSLTGDGHQKVRHSG